MTPEQEYEGSFGPGYLFQGKDSDMLSELLQQLKAQEIELARLRLTWIPERPTVPGWYWWRHGRGRHIEVVYIFESTLQPYTSKTLYVKRLGVLETVLISAQGAWAGPIEEPA